MTETGIGWGGAPFGASPWGGSLSSTPQLVGAVATSENVIQLTFSTAIYFSGLFDIKDASNRARYALAPVAGSIGLDGTPAKSIFVAAATLSPAGAGRVVLLNTDRPMTPNPAQYTVTCNGIWSADQSTPILSSATSLRFNALYKQIVLPQVQTLSARGDFANPQDLDAITSGVTPSPNAVQLGSFVIDDTGDYAVETGMTGYKKRILRRIISNPGSFLHLGPKYGAGVRQYGKHLASATKRAQLTASVETQVALEPETARVSVTTALNANTPGMTYLVVLARTKTGRVLKVTAPVNTST